MFPLLPTQFGESVVLRVLDRSAVNLDIESLGLPKYIFDYITEAIQQPNGIFVVTGPTGSGKTTTLYSCLRKVNTIDSQTADGRRPGRIRHRRHHAGRRSTKRVGMTFGKALRSFLRQDPDIIMVGEMRDLETAQIAIQASLTGHLVLSTLHTNDAPGAVTRLIDMGVEPFLISSTLMARAGATAGPHHLQELPHSLRADREPVVAAQPFAARYWRQSLLLRARLLDCNDTGYKGRKGIFELLVINDADSHSDQ